MTSPYRLLACAFTLVLACGDNANTTAATIGSETTDSTSPPITTVTTSTSEPTTGSTSAPTTTEGTATSTGETTSGGPLPAQCSQYLDVDACTADNACEWSQILSYTHGTQGCQGGVRDFCVPTEPAGGLTSVWKDTNGDIEVLQFVFTPTDLGPEWQVCDCDSPLACLCTGVSLDCPERLADFCAPISGENNCTNAAASGKMVCGWFTTSDEGPLDGMCDDPPWQDRCLAGTDLKTDTCDPISLPYVDQGYCQGWTDPVYWRDRDGVIEVTTVCGPKPAGWTLCVADDPSQPDECKCGCKI